MHLKKELPEVLDHYSTEYRELLDEMPYDVSQEHSQYLYSSIYSVFRILEHHIGLLEDVAEVLDMNESRLNLIENALGDSLLPDDIEEENAPPSIPSCETCGGEMIYDYDNFDFMMCKDCVDNAILNYKISVYKLITE